MLIYITSEAIRGERREGREGRCQNPFCSNVRHTYYGTRHQSIAWVCGGNIFAVGHLVSCFAQWHKYDDNDDDDCTGKAK